jgi:hypothetical protein
MSARCSGCGAPMIWAVTEAGKRMPLDAEPVPGGLFILDPADGATRGGSVPPVARYARRDLATIGARYTSHFATCPSASRFRR